MFRINWSSPFRRQRCNGLTAIVALLATTSALAQSPSPSSAATAKTPAFTKAPTPTPAPSQDELINSLSQVDLDAVISLIKKNFTKPDALTEQELTRATVQGLMDRFEHGLVLLPGKGATPGESAARFYSEIRDGHVGYLRLGTLNNNNLQAMDKSLADFAAKKVD